MTKREAFDRVLKFWSDHWAGGDKAGVKFLDQVAAYLNNLDLTKQGCYTLYVDYDPLDDLLPLVQNADIECRGYMFSADGIFNGRKFGTFITPSTKSIRFKDGYGDTGYEIRWKD